MTQRVTNPSESNRRVPATQPEGSPPKSSSTHSRDDEDPSGESQDNDNDDVIEVSGELLSETPDAPDSNNLLNRTSQAPRDSEYATSIPPSGSIPPFVPGSGPAPGSRPSSSAITHFDPLRAYLREVQRYPLLTPEQEVKLATHYAETGDVDAAATLVSANLRLVVKTAYEYRRAYRNIMDLIQEGNIGLMQAVRRFDPFRGVKLSTYAAWWIRAYILRFVLNNWRLVKVGTTQAQRKLFFNLNREKARLSAMGIEPSAAEIAKQLHVEESEVLEMDSRLAFRESSLDVPVGCSDGREVSRMEMMPSQTLGPDTMLVEEQFFSVASEQIRAFRATLRNEKEIAIFDERLLSDEPLTLQELGARFGVSRERVRQIEARMMTHLRAYLEQELGDAVSTI